MPKKIILKTGENKQSVSEFLNSIEDEGLRSDSKKILKLFKSITNKPAKMWGPSIIGFGKYTYYRSNGDVGEYLATGFSPRKSGPTVYIMPGYQNYEPLLKQLGPHKLGKSCLYLKSLDSIDLSVLEKLIKRGLQDLKKTHSVDY